MTKTLVILFLLLTTFGGGSASASDTPRKAAQPSDWSAKMQEMYKTLAEILGDVVSDRRFNDPANFKKIEKNAKKLSELSHDINKKGIIAPDADPTLQMLSGLFSDETNRAYQELKQGHRPYARNLLQSLSGYCIACHTRNQSGPQFSTLPIEPSKDMTDSFERAEFFAASRQFDRAYSELKKLAHDSSFAASRPLAWEKAVNHALVMAVRTQRDPARALDIINAIQDNPGAAYFLKLNAAQWKKSLKEWQDEANRTPKTEEGLFAEATRLIAKARELQKYPVDRSGDIYYLRASAVIHELLQVAPNGDRAPEALMLAGMSYEVLSPLKLNDLHELYYAACIRKAPHTPMAEICYGRYQESLHAGYTGSGGTEIPADIKKRMTQLEDLARPRELAPKEDTKPNH
jgi:hypothetical protein